MTTVIELVRGYIDDVEIPLGVLEGPRTILDDAIASEVARAAQRGSDGTGAESPRRRSRPVLRWSAAATVAAAVAALVVFLPTPNSEEKTPEAAAAEIARLADVVPPVPPLAPGEWYDYQVQGLLLANVSNGAKTPGGPPINPAEASVPVTLGEWSNSAGAVCTSQGLGTATFSDAANAQAWSSLGLSDTPSNQPATDCAAGVEAINGYGSSFPPIDVSDITHDPATLARQLQSSSTGIAAIDDYAVGNPVNQAAFERLAVLLVSPSSGEWPGFGQEMLQTMALIPDVISLGTLTSHAGNAGLAFTAQTDVTMNPSDGAVVSSLSPPTVILDPQSGAVLEARNMDFPVLSSAAQDFVGSQTASVYTNGASYGVTAQWLDPTGPLKVVAGSSLPGWTGTYHIIEVVSNASTTQAQISSVVNPFLGNGNMAFGDQNAPAEGQETLDITIMGTAANEQTVLSALTASGLFASISVKL